MMKLWGKGRIVFESFHHRYDDEIMGKGNLVFERFHQRYNDEIMGKRKNSF